MNRLLTFAVIMTATLFFLACEEENTNDNQSCFKKSNGGCENPPIECNYANATCGETPDGCEHPCDICPNENEICGQNNGSWTCIQQELICEDKCEYGCNLSGECKLHPCASCTNTQDCVELEENMWSCVEISSCTDTNAWEGTNCSGIGACELRQKSNCNWRCEDIHGDLTFANATETEVQNLCF